MNRGFKVPRGPLNFSGPYLRGHVGPAGLERARLGALNFSGPYLRGYVGPAGLERARLGALKFSAPYVRCPTKIVWRGPPCFSRARTRCIVTVKPAQRRRCSNLRSSHADQTANTPPGLRAACACVTPWLA